MRHFGSAIVLLLLSPPSGATDLTRDELSKRLSSYHSLKSFEVPFRQTKKLKGVDFELRSRGTLHVDRRAPYKIDWRVVEPAPIEVHIEESKIEIVTGLGNKQSRQTFDRKQATSQEATKGFARLGAWMRMDAEELDRQYRIEAMSPSRLRFLPKETDSIRKVEIEIGKNGQLQKMQLFEISDDEIEIEFGKLKSL
jgi:hypothetical protein